MRSKRSKLVEKIWSAKTPPEAERFESLLDNLLVAISRAPAHEIDRELDRWLREIVLTLDIDRSTLWERTFDDRGFVATHWWGRPNVPAMPRAITSMLVSPWATEKILAGETIAYTRIDDIPKDAPKLRAFAEKYGPKANVTLPIQIGSTIIGALSFGKFRGPREWSPGLLRRLRVVAQAVGPALERKRVELQIRSLQHQVNVAARRSTMGELAASIAHEINQPLGAIGANASAARRLASSIRGNSEEVVAALRDIVEDAKRAHDIIRRIRGLFRDDDSHKTMLEVGAFLTEVEALLHSEASMRNISLRIEIEPSLPPILGDRIQLQQCVINLVLNAFEALAGARETRNEVLVRVASEGEGTVSVSVWDSGPGIAASISEKIFEPFVTTKPNGMGMGLSVTRSIVEDHGGRLQASSNADVGSTFTFSIPAIREARTG